ncbi:MAG: CTB family bacteriocin [Sphaerospermopsis kisseleviana]
MMKFKWFIELSDQEQEFLTGGSLPQISNNNFSQRAENTTENNSTTPLGKVPNNPRSFNNPLGTLGMF